MGSLAGLDDLVNRATGGNSGTPENLFFSKLDRIAGTAITFVAQRYYSLWCFDGYPGAGVAPGAVAIPDNTTNGGLKQANPGGGRQKWLTSFGNFLTLGEGSILLYDRLLHVSGLSGTVTTAQAVGGTITRYTGAESWNNQAWVEIYGDIGATARTISMVYTDQDGNTGITSQSTTIGSASFLGQARMIPIPLASGDSGVRAVQDVTLSASTGTAGDFGITIMRPLVELTMLQVGGGGLATYLESIPEIKASECLAMMFLPHGLGRLSLCGHIASVEA